jgi:hypothetical protein
MSVQSQIPSWLQWAWAIAGLVVAVGGLMWTLLILWPYIRLTRAVMTESLRLSRATAEALARLERDGQLEKTCEAIREIPGRLDRLHGGEAAPEVEVPRMK